MRRAPAWLGIALAVAACATTSPIRQQVIAPAPSQPVDSLFIEPPDVQSRETGDGARERNADVGKILADALRSALQARGKGFVTPPADTVRARVYVAYGDAPVRTKDRIKGEAHIEIRLQLLEPGTETIRYSTYTIAPIRPSLLSKVGWAPETQQMIQDALKLAATDFASRL